MFMSTKTSACIQVQEFRQILIWPLRLKDCGNTDIGCTERHLSNSPHWEKVDDPLRHLDPDAAELPDAAYQEFVYFHPFVQSFLYGKNAAMRVFRRTDIQAVRLCLSSGVTGTFEIDLAVDRLNLYLFPGGNAVVALEISCGGVAQGEERLGFVRVANDLRRLNLAHAQVILERFRRLYPPYWDQHGAGLSPMSVRWIGKIAGDTQHTMPDASHCIRHVDTHRRPPLAEHWRWLVRPLRFVGDDAIADDDRHVWTHVVDERIPSLAFLALDDPHAVEPGDWVRLAMLDEAGSAPMPYAPGFLAGFRDKHCYDRHWDDADTAFSSRYLMSGYGFAAIGRAGNWFFANPVRQHVRRHYFQMGLIAHFQNAALLTLSDRLSQAVQALDDDDTDQADAILKDVLAFTQRSWFPDISNHVQAREMYGMWRRNLDVDTLYDQVMAEAKALNEYLASKQAARLNTYAAIAVIPAVLTGALGMNVVVGSGAAYIGERFFPPSPTNTATAETPPPNPAGEWVVLGLGMAVGLFLWLWLFKRWNRAAKRRCDPGNHG